jgi:DNA-binding CsgD family transcriptional regulator
MRQFLSLRTTGSWLTCLSAMTFMDDPDEDLVNFIAQCPLSVGVLDLNRVTVVAMSPRMARVLNVPEGRVDLVDMGTLVGNPHLLDALFSLVRGGGIDAYGARRSFWPDHDPPLDVDVWVAVSTSAKRDLALWVVIPIGEDPGQFQPEPTPAEWPTRVSGLMVGSFGCNWVFDRVSVDAESVVGLRVSELVDRPVADFVHPDDMANLFAAAAQAVADHAGVGVLVRFRHGSGQWTESHMVVTRLNGTPVRFGFALTLPADRTESGLDRVASLERHLWRIAREIELSGVASGFSRVPDITELPGLSELSGRQWEVLTRLLRGDRVPAIAEDLFVTQSTVRNHLAEVYRKLGVHSQQDLLALLRPDARATLREASENRLPALRH